MGTSSATPTEDRRLVNAPKREEHGIFLITGQRLHCTFYRRDREGPFDL
jgi:hypothetical protein